MKHISYADKAVFVDDETADLLLDYAGLLAAQRTGDTVTVRAIGQDGNEVDVTFVLNMATNMAGESTNSEVEVPANPVAAQYMREKIRLIRNPPPARPVEGDTLPTAPSGDGQNS